MTEEQHCPPECRVILAALQKAQEKLDDKVTERLKIRHFQWIGGIFITVLCVILGGMWHTQTEVEVKLDAITTSITRVEVNLSNHLKEVENHAKAHIDVNGLKKIMNEHSELIELRKEIKELKKRNNLK